MIPFFANYLKDQIIFLVLQLGFVLMFVYGVAIDVGLFRKKSNLAATVKRGEKSWNYFHLFYGFSLLIMIEIISYSEAFVGYKTLVSLIDICILTYLVFYNGWFRNKIIGFIVSSQNKEET